MNRLKPGGRSGGAQAPSPKRCRPGLRMPCSPSPQPSPQGEGEPFGRALIIRPSLVVVGLRNDGERSGDCNRNVRILQRRPSALPLLGERVGVRGNESNSNPGRTTISGTVKSCESSVRYVFSVVGTLRCDVRAACSGATASNANVARILVPPATTRAGTAQRAIPTTALYTYLSRARSFPILL